jgi:hypothetical protein
MSDSHASEETEVQVAAPAGLAQSEVDAAGSGSPVAERLLELQRSAGNRAVGRMLARAPAAKPPRIGPAATIPGGDTKDADQDPRGDVERGYYATTDKVMYGVRASSTSKPEGLWMDHLFDTQSEAEEYAKAIAASGERAIRENSALPYAWQSKTPGGAPSPGNRVQKVYVVKVPEGTPYIQGVVRAQPEGSKRPWLDKDADDKWSGGGPQLVISWTPKTKAVASFDVAPRPGIGAPVPPPPAWVTSAATTGDPRAVAQFYAPSLVATYRGQQALYNYSSTALADLEAKEEKAKQLGVELSEEDKKAKELLTAQVKAAQAKMLQARKDYEMVQSPGSTPQQIQEMFARRGIPVPVTSQTEQSGAAALKGTGISGWGLDDKGLTKKSATAKTRTVLGPDGKPIAITDEDSSSTNYGFLTKKTTTGQKTTVVKGDDSAVVDQSKSTSIDVLKATVTKTDERNQTITDDKGTTTKTANKTTTSYGIGGVTRDREESKQVGDKLDSKSSSIGVVRTPGMLGISAGNTQKSGTMVGDPGQEKMDKGIEKSNKITGGLVSDDKGSGLGGTAGQDRTTHFGKDSTLTTTVSAGGRCQALVVEVPGSDPPKFTITTTISFDFTLGANYGKDFQAQPGAQADTGLKVGGTIGGGASAGAYASFKRQLTESEAKTYLDYIKANGRGSPLPEHKILATGASQGWDAAKRLWQAWNGSPEMLKTMKPGDEVETNAELSGNLKGGLSGGQSGSGGLSIGGSLSAKDTHKVNVHNTIMPDGKVMVTASVGNEGTAGGEASVSIGAAGGKVGKSYTSGGGKAVTFILDPKDPAFNSEVAAINACVTEKDLDDLAARLKNLLASKTDTKTEGEGDTVGANAGPFSLEMGGTAKVVSDVTRDKDGNVISTKVTGTSTGGGTVGVGDVKIGDSQTDTFTGDTEVDKEGKQHAVGKSEHSTSGFSASKTWAAIKNVPKDPLHAIVAGPGSLVKTDTTSDKTMYYGQGDFDQIVNEAHNEQTWMAHVVDHNRDEWRKTMNAIRAASHWVEDAGTGRGRWQYDSSAVQAALAHWQAYSGGSDATDYVVRNTGSGDGGVKAAFPGTTSSLEADFKRYVMRDQVAESAAARAYDTASAGSFMSGQASDPDKLGQLIDAALKEMNDVQTHLATLNSGLAGQASQFPDPGVHGEMMGAITKRLTSVRNEIRALEDARANNIVAAPVPMKGGKVDKAAQAKADADAAAAKTQAQADASAKDAANAEQIARANFDQMWRYNASISGLIGKARALNAKDFSANVADINRNLDDASAALKHWRELRQKNTELVTQFHMGDWLNGPDPGGAQNDYDAVWTECHKGY